MSLRWPIHNINVTTPIDYSADWRRWLQDRTIVSVLWQIENAAGELVSFTPVTTVNGLTATAATNTDKVSTLYLTGGNNNVDYRIHCTITPSDGSPTTRVIRIRTKAL
jgi:hypothetical protein